MLDELGRFGFDPNRIDPTLIYRALREMEDMELVESRWESASQGPKRRVYALLPAGEEQLSQWVEELKRTRNEIDQLLSLYETGD
jgi:DNA-binding PadR family transcriptional regulator